MKKPTSARQPFFDTNILIYAHLTQDHPRTLKSQQLLESGGLIGVQQLNEFASLANRKLGKSWDEISQTLTDIRVLCPDPHPLTVAIHEMAISVAQRYGYSIYDALIIAAALDAGCTTLYSEDMQDGQQIGTLTIRNSFRS